MKTMHFISLAAVLFGAAGLSVRADVPNTLTDADRAYLYDAIRLVPFELGLRLFQDYLAGDIYFKGRQPGQNLNRARVQFRLCEAIEARERSIRGILEKL